MDRSGFCAERKECVNDFREHTHWFIGLQSKKCAAGSKDLGMRGGDQEKTQGHSLHTMRLEEWIQLCQYNA